LNSSGKKTGELLLVLLTGVCLAANGLSAVDSSTANTAQKRVVHTSANSTHPTLARPVARKAGTHATVLHSAGTRRAAPHPGTVHSTARRPASHPSSVATAKKTPNLTTTSAAKSNNARTRNKRVHTSTGQQRLARVHLQPDRTQAIQQALIREGYLHGDANGQWDARTHDAMQRYQTDHGFPATGLPEAKSLMKLGLGSHPLPSELDHSPVGSANPAAAPGDLTGAPSSPSVSQVTPPS
jgi:hypothetical protein